MNLNHFYHNRNSNITIMIIIINKCFHTHTHTQTHTHTHTHLAVKILDNTMSVWSISSTYKMQKVIGYTKEATAFLPLQWVPLLGIIITESGVRLYRNLEITVFAFTPVNSFRLLPL